MIRRAMPSDAFAIRRLLTQLGYPVSDDFVQRRLASLLQDQNQDLIVGEGDDKNVIGFLAMHCAANRSCGCPSSVDYLCVDEVAQGKGMGRLEEFAWLPPGGAIVSSCIATSGGPMLTASMRAKDTAKRRNTSSRSFELDRPLRF
jgi:hypothetical protein